MVKDNKNYKKKNQIHCLCPSTATQENPHCRKFLISFKSPLSLCKITFLAFCIAKFSDKNGWRVNKWTFLT